MLKDRAVRQVQQLLLNRKNDNLMKMIEELDQIMMRFFKGG